MEPKLIAGIALMVLATVIGALTMERATRRVSVWQLEHALAAGTRVTSADVHLAEISMQGAAVYAPASMPVVGRVVIRDLSVDELVPLAALGTSTGQYDRVTVPVEPLHLPPALRRGQRVDVWLTPRGADGSIGPTQRVLAALVVDSVGASDVSGHPAVVVSVPHREVAALIAALRLGSIDLVGVAR